ncbi:MAG: hypothetical protein Fur0012_03580 [Elusimicrobiota bacterium]
MKYFTLILFFAGLFAYAQKETTREIPQQEIARVKAEIDSLSKQPDSTGGVEKYLKIGKLYAEINDVDNAQAAFEKVLSMDEKNNRAHFMLGLIFEKKKMTEKALYHWEKCLEYASHPGVKEIASKHINYLSRK